MNNYCGRCKKRETCRELCEIAREYADQDEIASVLPWAKGGKDPEQCSQSSDTRTLWDCIENIMPFTTSRTSNIQRGPKPRIDDENGEVWEIIERFLLTDKQRDTLRLFYWDGLTQEEIAIVFKITQPVVARRLEIARRKLRAYLHSKGR